MKLIHIGVLCSLLLLLNGCDPYRQNEEVGTVTGAVAGGLLGSAIGQGTGQAVAIGVGAIGGALIGNAVGRSMDEQNTYYCSSPSCYDHDYYYEEGY